MKNEVEHLIIEFRELMIIKRGIKGGLSKKKLRGRLKEIEDELRYKYWDKISPNVRERIGIRPPNPDKLPPQPLTT